MKTNDGCADNESGGQAFEVGDTGPLSLAKGNGLIESGQWKPNGLVLAGLPGLLFPLPHSRARGGDPYETLRLKAERLAQFLDSLDLAWVITTQWRSMLSSHEVLTLLPQSCVRRVAGIVSPAVETTGNHSAQRRHGYGPHALAALRWVQRAQAAHLPMVALGCNPDSWKGMMDLWVPVSQQEGLSVANLNAAAQRLAMQGAWRPLEPVDLFHA